MAVAPASRGTKRPPRVGSTALAVATLRDLGMPWAEIDAIVQTHDPRLVRRYLQLHAERLEERVAAQRALLLNIEPFLVPGSARPRAADESPDPWGSDMTGGVDRLVEEGSGCLGTE